MAPQYHSSGPGARFAVEGLLGGAASAPPSDCAWLGTALVVVSDAGMHPNVPRHMASARKRRGAATPASIFAGDVARRSVLGEACVTAHRTMTGGHDGARFMRGLERNHLTGSPPASR